MGAAGLCYTSLFPKSRKTKRLTAYTEQRPIILGMIIIWSIQRMSLLYLAQPFFLSKPTPHGLEHQSRHEGKQGHVERRYHMIHKVILLAFQAKQDDLPENDAENSKALQLIDVI